MASLIDAQGVATAMLDALDDFMSGSDLTPDQEELQDAAVKAGSFAAAAFAIHAPRSGGEYHALTRAFLLALVDPLSPELDYLRTDPLSGELARDQRRQSAQ